jgi:Dyp-type peroxidase family
MAAAHLIERDDVQGLVASGYGHLPHATYLLAAIDEPAAARAWLGEAGRDVTTATGKSAGPAVNIALSAAGLRKLGLREEVLAGFSREFLGGMTDDTRSRFLGDVDDNAPASWEWGRPDEEPIDLVLMLYAQTPRALRALVKRHRTRLADRGVRVLRELDGTSDDREHFGFRDGISQPAVEGLREGPADQTVSSGEFVLGYPNEYGLLTDRPLVAAAHDPAGLLPAAPEDASRRDLGRNGTYLVFRQLSQDVPAFWRFVEERAANGRASRVALAAKMVGRWPGGAPLVLAPDFDNPALAVANEFRYFDTDADGMHCPLGAHVRRSHPRDSLDPDPGSDKSIAVGKRHRILRRGRKYGPPLAADAALNGHAGDTQDRGLHFICLCANISRQFEFVQHTWVNNPKFKGLYEDADPLMGAPGRAFTVQASPVRKRYTGLPSFVRTRGGAYFFLPGVRALHYLARTPGG